MQKSWKIKSKIPDDFLKQFPEYPPIVLQLLWDRGLATQKQIDEFFNPDYEGDLHDPFLLKDCKKAVDRILEAIEKKEKILIYGDYDCDGVCGTVILRDTLKTIIQNGDEEKSENIPLQDRLGIYLPDRELEGYGLNEPAIKKFAAEKVDLIVTIDCGISNYKEVELAKKLGMEVVVIDHHAIPPIIPKAHAVIDPHQKEDKYPFKDLAGAGVAFKIACALLNKFLGGSTSETSKDNVREVEPPKLTRGWEKWFLDLVALATVTDCMPLLGENRALVKYGLVVLAQTQRRGLRELMKIARVAPSFNRESLKTNLNHHTLGFVIGPRLNAAGRMDHANTAYELLTTDSDMEAKELAEKLNVKNRERQRMVDEIVVEIDERCKMSDISSKKLIFEGKEGWSLGLVGVAAGRIAEKYWRPTLVFRKEDEFSHGSGRSIPNFNLIEAIQSCSHLLEKFGGHPGAAGFTVRNENLEKFKNCLENFARKNLKEEDLVSVLDIDAEIIPENINWELYDALENFEPFGEANERPKFLAKGLKIREVRLVGNGGKHLKLTLEASASAGGQKILKAIWFCVPAICENLKIGDMVDIVFELDIDEWNGNRELSLKIVDLKQINK